MNLTTEITDRREYAHLLRARHCPHVIHSEAENGAMYGGVGHAFAQEEKVTAEEKRLSGTITDALDREV